MLERFHEVKAREVEALKLMKQQGTFPAPWNGVRPSFAGALRTCGGVPSVIAEYKRASPSRGLICESVSVEDAVCSYAANGASALSILTEEVYFKGHLSFISRARAALDAQGFSTVPILRKEFILDPLQIEATFSVPASAVLLIVRLTPDAGKLRDLRLLAESQGIDCVVEVFDDQDLALARESGARIIQVNARDLDTFQVDRKACLAMIRTAKALDGETWIAASGILEGSHLVEAGRAGFAAGLVGTALMKDGTPGSALHTLLDEARVCAAGAGPEQFGKDA